MYNVQYPNIQYQIYRYMDNTISVSGIAAKLKLPVKSGR